MTTLYQREPTTFRRSDATPSGWARSARPAPYLPAVSAMERHVEAMARGEAGELVWLLEHPSLYSAGVSAKASDLLTPDRFPVFRSGRGGQFTYHGPGQRVVYVMLDLRKREKDTRAFVTALETWLIDTLAGFGVRGETRRDRVGVWVRPIPDRPTEAKIAAIGVKLRRWISFHGISLNVAPDLDHFAGIIPCGIADAGVTSLAALGVDAGMAAVDCALRDSFQSMFGPVIAAEPPLMT